jgi:beta-galactosidase
MTLLACLIAIAFVNQAAAASQAPFISSQSIEPDEKPLRTRYTINDGWKFLRSDVAQAELPPYDDSSWTSVSMPHTWNVEDTLDDTPGYYRGVGWYRRNVRLGPEFQSKNLFLYFEGVNQIAEVYVNGCHAGQHIGGYTAFAIEITDFLRFDSATGNTIAVKVDNSHREDIPPLNADFNFYGGIYRDVWLVAVDPVHITLLDHGSSGVQITTPQVSSDHATLRLRGTIVNTTDKQRDIEVISTLIDAAGRDVAELSSTITVAAKGQVNFDQTSLPIVSPQLWSPDNPYLYTVRTNLRIDGRLIDEVTNPLGFRWFSFDPSRGFFLNGQHLKLRGTNRHQDYAGMGNAVPDSLQVRDLEIIKETGFNFLRLAHYPQDPSVLNAADRLGLIIWEEIPIVNQITLSAQFNENSKQMLTEMIRQHRNHPSVVLWGYMNEVFLRAKISDENTRGTVALARVLEAICHREDPDRVTAIAFDHGARELYFSSGLGDVTQVVGWNLYHGWYHEEFADFGKFIDQQHRRFPRRPLILSEYGANGDTRLHSLKPRRFDSTLEWQRQLHEAYLPQIDARPFIAASAVWNQFDFGSEFRGETIPHINQKGLLTFDRRPKDTLYLYTAYLSRGPMLHIATADWRHRTGTNDSIKGFGFQPVKQTIDVYTNLAVVELRHDDVSLGQQRVGESHVVSWEVPMHHGANVLVARGTHNGRIIADRVAVRFDYYSPMLSDRAVPFKHLAVNVGSNAQFIDQSSTVWEADQPYRAGGWGYLGNATKPVSTLKNVLNTFEDPLYQTMQEGLQSYRFDVPDGDYEIELRFVEYEFSKANQRVFNVLVNGEYLLRGLDLAKDYGLMQPLTLRSCVRATGANGVRVDFIAVTGRPVLSAIRIKRIA